MSTELITTEKGLTKDLSQLNSYDDFFSVSTKLIDSSFTPTYIDSPETLASILMLGKELNFAPMSAIQNIINVQGKLTLTSAGMVSVLRKAGMRLKIIEDFEPVKGMLPDPNNPKEMKEQVVDYRTTVELMELWNGQVVTNRISALWTELVKAATDNGTKKLPATYVKYARNMAYARCVSRLIRSVAADVLAGSNYTTVEIGMDAGLDMQVINGEVEVATEDVDWEVPVEDMD